MLIKNEYEIKKRPNRDSRTEKYNFGNKLGGLSSRMEMTEERIHEIEGQ